MSRKRKRGPFYQYIVKKGSIVIFETNDWSAADFFAQENNAVVIDILHKKRVESIYANKQGKIQI